MRRNKSSVSKASSYREIGKYWDSHDLSEVWNKTRKVKFEVDIDSETTYYPLERNLSEKVRALAKKQGISSHTLINLWVQQKLHAQIVR